MYCRVFVQPNVVDPIAVITPKCSNDTNILSIADLAHYPVIHMRRALLEQAGGFQPVLDWADKVRQFSAVGRAIDYAALELPV